MPTRIDERGWCCLLPGGDAWHLLLGAGEDGPEVWLGSRDERWRVRWWLGGICTRRSGSYATKLEAQRVALRECGLAGIGLRYQDRPGRWRDVDLADGATAPKLTTRS